MLCLVCGGRDWYEVRLGFQALDWLHAWYPITTILHGGARGGDTVGKEWAEARGIQKIVDRADWTTYGKRAGPIRNRVMLSRGPQYVVAFPGNNGTADMIKISREAGVTVWQPYG